MKNFSSSSDLSYCGELVKQADPDRFLLSMFVPHACREAIWALLAFNHEIAKTREIVSESTLGHIRLQWWRDAIEKIYKDDVVLEHEVLKPLARAIHTYDLSRELFDKLIYAREFDLENIAPASIEGLFNYADFTTTPLLRLISKVMGDDAQYDDTFLCSISVRYTVVGILRATPHYARQGRWMLPQDLSERYGVNIDTVFEDVGVERVVVDIVNALPAVHKSSQPFFKSSLALSDVYLKQLQGQSHNVMSPILQHEPSFKTLRVFWKTKYLCF